MPNGSGLKQQITPPPDFTDPVKLLEEIIGRPIPGENEGHGKEDQDQLEKPAELVENVDFGGRSIHDFLEDEEEQDGIGALESYDDTAQSAMECEYVYSCDIANAPILKMGIR